MRVVPRTRIVSAYVPALGNATVRLTGVGVRGRKCLEIREVGRRALIDLELLFSTGYGVRSILAFVDVPRVAVRVRVA